VEAFGLEGFRLIDSACGSGHFLLGAFARFLDRWAKREPATPRRTLVQRVLDSIHGVDLNPYAVAIARFRLLLAAWQACGVTSLANAPDFHLNLVCGDSLLHGIKDVQGSLGFASLDHYYQPEDRAELERLLQPGRYHAVVANPPYITPKDRALNQAYRDHYSACHMKYSLAVPFMQRLFSLAVKENLTQRRKDAKKDSKEDPSSLCGFAALREVSSAGFVGQITANSFMKREFGKKLIEEFFPTVDLTHVIDTSGAYIPGHGTPTVILFGRNRQPVASTIRTVMGIRGEPTTRDDPAQGQVWSAILHQIDQPGSQSAFVSVAVSPRENFHKHPWSIGGGGAAELKEQLDKFCERKLDAIVDSIGVMVVTGSDDAYSADRSTLTRRA
jgi:hypothetical protein